MSYILEALKKAQTERQLGVLPTIHASPPYPGCGADGRRHRLVLGGGMILALATLSIVLWRQPWQAAAPAAAAPVLVEAVIVPPPVLATVALAKTAAPMPKPAPALVPALAQAVTKAPDDGILTLNELPEPIQRQIPPLAIGGYIYSKNPTDRLVLIDKVLRHEGEELAPGLTLEKLQAKSAVFGYKGYRYRVAY